MPLNGKKHTKTETSANSNKCEKRKTDEETDRQTNGSTDGQLAVCCI